MLFNISKSNTGAIVMHFLSKTLTIDTLSLAHGREISDFFVNTPNVVFPALLLCCMESHFRTIVELVKFIHITNKVYTESMELNKQRSFLNT